MQEVFSTLSSRYSVFFKTKAEPPILFELYPVVCSKGGSDPQSHLGNVHRPPWLEQWWVGDSIASGQGMRKANILQSEGCSLPTGDYASHLPLTPALRKLYYLPFFSFLSEPHKVDESFLQHFPHGALYSALL